jgi:hypothetical protein
LVLPVAKGTPQGQIQQLLWRVSNPSPPAFGRLDGVSTDGACFGTHSSLNATALDVPRYDPLVDARRDFGVGVQFSRSAGGFLAGRQWIAQPPLRALVLTDDTATYWAPRSADPNVTQAINTVPGVPFEHPLQLSLAWLPFSADLSVPLPVAGDDVGDDEWVVRVPNDLCADYVPALAGPQSCGTAPFVLPGERLPLSFPPTGSLCIGGDRAGAPCDHPTRCYAGPGTPVLATCDATSGLCVDVAGVPVEPRTQCKAAVDAQCPFGYCYGARDGERGAFVDGVPQEGAVVAV